MVDKVTYGMRLSISTVTLLILSACTSQDVIDIEGSDNKGLYTIQTSFPVVEKAPVYLKLRASRTSADFSQDIPDGKYVFFEDLQITGPDGVTVESDIDTASISIGFLDDAGIDRLSMAIFLGVSQTRFNADVFFQSGPSVMIRDRIRELYLDAGIWYEVADRLKLGLAYALSMNADVSGLIELELSLSYRLLSHMEITVGLRDFTYNYNEGESRSSLWVQSKGPFVMLNFPF
ncbi:hypothetical protein ACFL3P_03790 [Pseudomonadota bacterium]